MVFEFDRRSSILRSQVSSRSNLFKLRGMILPILGVQTAVSHPKTNGETVGGFAPHPIQLVCVRETAAWTPQHRRNPSPDLK